jgi:prepilin-type N-terminal cleavage/methylation domain-containing protein
MNRLSQAPARSVKDHANIGLPSSGNLSGRLGPSSGGPGDQAQNQPLAAWGWDNHAFSLVEILVVIGIIAVLAALAVPVVATAMTTGRKARCAANLKTLSAAIFSYCSDNNGIFPPVTPASTGGSVEDYWHRQITPYLGETNFDSFTGRGNMANIFLCPSDPAPWFGKLSYGLNAEVRGKRLPNVTRSSAVLLADSRLPNLSGTSAKTNHGKRIQFSRVDGSLGVATNLGTAASQPEFWLLER